ncbi:MAG: AMP-binding protein, partial [Myxococcota bacterium]
MPAHHPLSHAQEVLWTGQALLPEVPLYNMGLRFDIDGPLDPERFEAALQAVVARTDALRLVFTSKEGRLQQLATGTLPLIKQDFSDAPHPDDAAEAWIQERVKTPFALERQTSDTALLRLGPDRWCWYLCQHHLVADASSMALIFARVATAYAEDGHPVLPSDYVKHARREAEGSRTSKTAKAREAWRHFEAHGVRPFGAVSAAPTHHSHRTPVPIDQDLRARLDALASKADVRALTLDLTRTQLLTCAVLAYLYKVTGRAEQVMTLPVHNRVSPAARNTAGLFMELFPMRVELSGQESFRSLLGRVREGLHACLRRAVPGSSSVAPLRSVPVVLNHIRAAFGRFADLPARARWLHPGASDPGHALRFQIHELDASGEWTVDIDVNGSIPNDIAARVPEGFRSVLEAMLQDFDGSLDRVELGPHDRSRVLAGPSRSRSSEETVLGLFQARVERAPKSEVLRSGDQRWTAAELHDRAADIAGHLRSLDIGPGDRVALALPRSPDLVASVLGVLGVGAAYVPLDVRGPRKRMEQILADARPTHVLANPELAELVPAEIQGVPIAKSSLDRLSGSRTALISPSPEALAYLLYTSGSTGQPKGVMVSHRGLHEYVTWAQEQYSPRPRAFAFHSPMTFDLTVTSVFVPLVADGRLIVFPETSSRIDFAVLDAFADPEVDVIKLTPSHLNLVLDGARDLPKPHSGGRTLILGGEALETALCRRAEDLLPGDLEILNEYGPTEGVVGCMIHRFAGERDVGGAVPIGVPAENTELRILDSGGNPLPPGVPGELALARRGLAVGYLNRENETALRFRPDADALEGRIYLTGDEDTKL